MEAHVDDGVAFNEALELLDDRMKRFVDPGGCLDMSYHLAEPLFQDVLVVRKPATKAMLHPSRLRTIVSVSMSLRQDENQNREWT